MNISQIENNLQELIFSFSEETFIYDLLLSYGLPKSSITRLKKGNLNLSKVDGEKSWKKKLFFKEIFDQDLHLAISSLIDNIKHDQRFVIVTDYKTLLAIDTKTQDKLDIELKDLPKHYDFFLPWAGMEKTQHQNENPADVKAAEKMAKLFDEIKKDNPDDSPEFIHGLNVFLCRLLFCYFAEDTNIFEEGQFTNVVASHTQGDGSDLDAYLDKLFVVLNTSKKDRQDLPAYLNVFPYVNGGLFRQRMQIPKFTRRSYNAIIDSGKLDWSVINPDIFGSMMQAVISPEQRGGLGMHYTSVPNIMKVIEPLFLNGLKEDFEKAKGNQKKRNELLKRLYSIKIFDPACGSGNFLIIAYKELRRLEMEIFKEQGSSLPISGISLGQFYGIELDDFAHEIAQLSLWLAEHQMNVDFFKEFGCTNPTLPLKEAGHIVQGNACRVDWETVCPKRKDDEIYVLGNPPYLGSSMQDQSQKADLATVFKGFKNYKNLDYIACWFKMGADFVNESNSKFAFVSTNSICQGEQVNLLWPYVFHQNLEIDFAYKSFKWTNSAKKKAAVIVIIVGVRKVSKNPKYIFVDGLMQEVPNINPYLTVGSNITLPRRNKPISKIPEMLYGNKPTDGGNLILDKKEVDEISTNYPISLQYIKKFSSGADFLNGNERWCLWITDDQLESAQTIPPIYERLKAVAVFRKKSKAQSTVDYSIYPNRFRQITYKETQAIIVPLTSSERREYIPFGHVNANTVVSNSSSVIYSTDYWIFGVVSSKMHMLWVKTVSGRLKSDYRYSSALCYNNFPFIISEQCKEKITKSTLRIIEEREKNSPKTLAQLYDPDKMPEGLREAHRLNDLAVERCYRSKPFESDEERLEYMFKLYGKMTSV
ncbi:class I SAM-dependent DNA methyltransferase [Methanococcoides seepicolus]|uniref:site-specific DNA-methyltransferase (adenine-specific) n=1 Tax=Methanococcoides seepicolus TaxID=2828780 RepID=A0A9E5DAX5_9EURY|nr:DNA methyltransferase [Methanococcoides seepicolus]MCM1986292.1 class I SAM-dependent DNA methyltransferase [Methanococcoides seepicolus]